MRALWQRYGRDFYSGGGKGVTPAEVEALFDEISGGRFKPFFDKYIRGTEDVPLAKMLAPFGVKYNDERKSSKPSLDANIGRDGTDCKLSSVHENGAAHLAGLSAGDLLVAIDGLRVTATNLEALLSRYGVDSTVEVHAFRRDELMTFSMTLQGDRVPGITLTLDPAVKKSTVPLRPSADR
jgi:predicted metalloprotease with PDZ domain